MAPWDVKTGFCQAPAKYFPEMMWPAIEGVNNSTIAMDIYDCIYIAMDIYIYIYVSVYVTPPWFRSKPP